MQPWAGSLTSAGHPTIRRGSRAGRQTGGCPYADAHEELRQYTQVYALLCAYRDNLPAFGERMEVAAAIVRRSGDGHFSALDLQELMRATAEAQGRLALPLRLLHSAQHGLREQLTTSGAHSAH
jgi:hypothetical protein